MTVDWGEFLHHVILNPVDNIGELVSSWKHSLVRSRGHITSDDATLQRSRGVHLGMSDDTIVRLQVFDVGESRAMPIEFPEEASGFGEWKTFVLAAGLADAVSRSVTAPIDRLKTQLQVSSAIRCYSWIYLISHDLNTFMNV